MLKGLVVMCYVLLLFCLGGLWVDRCTWGNCQLERLRAEAYLYGGDGGADVEKRAAMKMNVRCDEVDEGRSRLWLFLVMEGCLQIKSDWEDRWMDDGG